MTDNELIAALEEQREIYVDWYRHGSWGTVEETRITLICEALARILKCLTQEPP